MKLKSKNKSKKVLIALSGGIDSPVSAHLLIKQGYQVEQGALNQIDGKVQGTLTIRSKA